MTKDDIIKLVNAEIYWRTSRSSGKGGQHVNKTESKVELLFSLHETKGFTMANKALLLEKLLSKFPNGVIKIVSQKGRSQHTNKEDALMKLGILLSKSLKRKNIRKPTKVSKSAVQKRLDSKKRNSALKKQRGNKKWNNE